MKNGGAEGVIAGRAEGRIVGERGHLLSLIRKKISKSKSPEVIAEEVEESVETVIAFVEEISGEEEEGE